MNVFIPTLFQLPSYAGDLEACFMCLEAEAGLYVYQNPWAEKGKQQILVGFVQCWPPGGDKK